MRRYIAIVLVLAACNKNTSSGPTPAFNVSASINGTPTTFNAIITVDSLSIPGNVYIVAHSDSANLTPLLEITIGSTPLKTGIYPIADSTTGPRSLLGYTAWSDSAGTFVQYPSVSDTVTITTVSQNWFSGTFQGTCEYSADSVVFVTNGKFTVGYTPH
jgi:hypothetical protein